MKNSRADENFPYRPKNPYAATKAASDHLINSYINTFQLNVIITNCCNNYGTKQNPEKFIPKIISNIINHKKLPVYGRGLNTREWIYVLDHCKALYKVFRKGKAGETYKSTAQGLITLATYGVGMLIGFRFAGWLTDQYVTETGHLWKDIWIQPAIFSFVVLTLFLFLFKNETIKIKSL